MTSTPDPDCGCRHTLTNEAGEQFTILHQMPKALSHYYPLPDLATGVIPLYRGKFQTDGKRYRGVISMSLDPRPTIDVSGVRDVTIEDIMRLDGSRGSAKWVDRPTVAVRAKDVPKPPKTPHLRWSRKAGTERRSWDPAPIDVGSGPVDEISFFVLNGWFAFDGLNTCYDGHDRPGRVQVGLGEWELRIEPRGDHTPKAVRDHMRGSGHSAVTHVGRIRRLDMADFDPNDAVGVLEVVETLVSFALGRVTSVALPVGMLNGEPVWSRWSALRAVDRPLGTTPWLDVSTTTAQLAELFQCGYAASLDALKWEVFQRTLGYYFSANFEATVTMKVMLPVSGLLMLSFAYFVETLPQGDPARLSKKAWKALTAEEAIRLLLDRMAADTTVPVHLAHLVGVQSQLASSGKPAPDGLSCVVKMRNDVAHPERARLARWDTYEWAEAGFEAMGFFDAAMLWWLDYQGRYMPRTAQHRSAGDAVTVPWGTGTP